MYCNACGATVSDARFCPNCGNPLPATSSATPTAAPRPAASQQPKTDSKAVVSLVLGILSLTLFSIFAGIPAVILGHVSRSKISKSMGRLTGAGMALAGLIMGYISFLAIPIILIIAAIAIPNLLRARIAANQASAVATLRTVNVAQMKYQAAKEGFAPDFTTLGRALGIAVIPQATCAADQSCQKSGFRFTLEGICEGGACKDYVAVATPIARNAGGTRSFCSTSDGRIRAQSGAVIAPLSLTDCQSWPQL